MSTKMTPQELNDRLQWSLDDKTRHAIYKILEYYVLNRGMVFLGFSGGKDSQIVEYLISGIFTEADIWAFADQEVIFFCEVYYDREIKYVTLEGKEVTVVISGEKRTGCMFCLFGIHLEPKSKLNRFQRLAITHPKQYLFMLNVCGLRIVLDFIGVDYAVNEDLLKIKQ